MIISRTEKLKRKVAFLEKEIRNKNPVDFLYLQIKGRDNQSVILELKIPIH